MSATLYNAALALYGLATLCYLVFFVRPAVMMGRICRWALGAGFACHCLYTFHRYFASGHTPITNPHESLSFFSLAVAGVFLAFQWRYRAVILGAFVMPVAFLMILASAFFPSSVGPLNPALKSGWLIIHAAGAFSAYAVFAVAFCAGVMYLLQEHYLKRKILGAMFHRLPSLDTLDDINYRCLAVGFPLLTAAIISGAIWAKAVWGEYWSWEPKQTWSLITWFVYAALLHGRLTTGWRGRRAAILAIAGFCVILFTYLGVNLLLPGHHGNR
ncbi:MAG: c-type cytochrome biogenesis protein CcsB [Geobacteraceae bacterium]|nr:c-type cytochrome biogenesis protein CcsB [Geobacteraceae bacterium]